MSTNLNELIYVSQPIYISWSHQFTGSIDIVINCFAFVDLLLSNKNTKMYFYKKRDQETLIEIKNILSLTYIK